ncbi:HSP20-like chaperone [Jimgerdemannia flammicorona]|uniref:HSP20-like chaperone n=1 Tax=Jimgerdemannia flammicorona TaxID=994334 RepID=A0A433QUH4_9FUNG|nr:HSP20-like chaperone [Jimgerdemannia flammicorona]
MSIIGYDPDFRRLERGVNNIFDVFASGNTYNCLTSLTFYPRSPRPLHAAFFQDLNATPRSIFGRGATASGWAPSIDVTETDKDLVIHAELPNSFFALLWTLSSYFLLSQQGVPKDKVKLDIREQQLIISGNHEENQDYNQGSARVRERRYGAFSRTIPLPQNIKADDTQAKFDQGVLEVRVPKTEATGGRSIIIQ